jgi:hypothetical protein
LFLRIPPRSVEEKAFHVHPVLRAHGIVVLGHHLNNRREETRTTGEKRHEKRREETRRDEKRRAETRRGEKRREETSRDE